MRARCPAGCSTSRVDHLRLFGRHLGVAFQCTDDVLGIWGRQDRTGKPVGADVAARKKTLPVIAALDDPGEPGRRLAALYRRDEPLGVHELVLAADLIERAGGRAAAESEARYQADLARGYLERAARDPAARTDLVAIASWAVCRDR